SKPVKRISFVAGLHGDELEGVFICCLLIRYLLDLEKSRPEAFKGEINIYPAVNPQAIGDVSRQWPFFSADMNRLFAQEVRRARRRPMDLFRRRPSGQPSHRSLPSHVAGGLLDDLAACSDLAVDFHTSNLHLKELPQIRILQGFDKELIPLARHCNMDLIWVHPLAKVFETTLGYNLNAAGIPALVVESGICLRLDPAGGDQVFRGMIHLLRQTGILETDNPGGSKIKTPLLSGPEQVVMVGAARSGLFVRQAELGRRVKRGETLGHLADPLRGTLSEEVTSPAKGLLFTVRDLPLAYAGATLARIALAEPEP
ncbi:MAG: M14 family metallopeptidase, partial [Nitrospinales bacterium]